MTSTQSTRSKRSGRRLVAALACIAAAGLVSVWAPGPGPDAGSLGSRSDRASHPVGVAENGSIFPVREPNPVATSSALGPGQRSPGPRATDPLPAWILEHIDTRDIAPESPISNRDPETAGGADGLDPRHLAVLQVLIDINELDESSSLGDFDDGDGIFEPTELGFQVWSGGRLIALSLGPDPYWTFDYRIRELPANLGDLDFLQYLDLHDNELTELPYSIGSLSRLRELRVHENDLARLPESLPDLANLIGVNLSDNALERLPESIGSLARLEWLFVNDNPLDTLPVGLGDLSTLRSLAIESRADASEPGVGLTLLPETLESLSSLDTLYVSGNHLGCTSSGPEPLLVDGSVRVFGLSAQRCQP